RAPGKTPPAPPQSVLLVDRVPALDPPIGPHERDLGPLRRPLAKLAEEEREARAQPLARARPDAARDLVGELLAKQPLAALEDVPDRRPGRRHLGRAERRGEHAGRIRPGGEAVGARA